MWALTEEDLLEEARHPWLNGRLLWLQIIVAGSGTPPDLGDYYWPTTSLSGHRAAGERAGHGSLSARERGP